MPLSEAEEECTIDSFRPQQTLYGVWQCIANAFQRGAESPNQLELVHRRRLLFQKPSGHSPRGREEHRESHACVSRFQKQIKLPSFKRGCHVITHQLVSGLSDIKDIRMGLVNFFSRCLIKESLAISVVFLVLHTSASLTINENASPDVPLDLNVGALMSPKE